MKQTRDMTRRGFNAALKRRGWRKVLVWIECDKGRSAGMVVINGKVNLRASLARAIQLNDKWLREDRGA